MFADGDASIYYSLKKKNMDPKIISAIVGLVSAVGAFISTMIEIKQSRQSVQV